MVCRRSFLENFQLIVLYFLCKFLSTPFLILFSFSNRAPLICISLYAKLSFLFVYFFYHFPTFPLNSLQFLLLLFLRKVRKSFIHSFTPCDGQLLWKKSSSKTNCQHETECTGRKKCKHKTISTYIHSHTYTYIYRFTYK